MLSLYFALTVIIINPPIDFDRLCDTILIMESSGGINCEARFEPRFLKNYGDKGNMPELRQKYGDEAAASSYGCFQIMLSTANQFFSLSPEQLADPVQNRIVAEYLLHRYMNRYGSRKAALWNIFKRWNGGSDYADKALSIYEHKS